MKWLGVALTSGAVAASALIGCGSSNGSGGSSGAGGASGTTGSSGSGNPSGGSTSASGATGSGGCDPNQPPMMTGSNCSALQTCLTAHCNSQATQCFGAGYMQGDYTGGACAPLLNCASACNCDATCLDSCTPDGACFSCLFGVASCEQTNCPSEVAACNGSDGSGGASGASGANGGGGFGGITFDAGVVGTCTDLAACCAILTGSDKTTCDQVLALGTDLLCGGALLGYQSQGKCP